MEFQVALQLCVDAAREEIFAFEGLSASPTVESRFYLTIVTVVRKGEMQRCRLV